MKTLLKIVLILLPLGLIIGLVWWGKSIWDSLHFRPYFVSADLKGLKLSDIPDIVASGQEKTINAKLGMEIKNDSSTAIKFCYLKAILSYRGIEIARTSERFADACSSIPKKGQPNNPLYVEDDVTIKLNRGGLLLLTDKFLGNKPKIDYQIQLSIFGIPITRILSFFGYPIKNSFEW